MKIVIGSDHGGYKLKEGLKRYLESQKIEVLDVGTNTEEEPSDYPYYGKIVGEKVVNDKYDFGIALCGTGIGISIAVNKVKGVRAALVYNADTARLAKEHNNANVIAIGGRITKLDDAIEMLNVYMNANFNPRHQNRIDLIAKMEE